MKITVVIPTYNKKDILLETLAAFTKQTYNDFEIIIIDDGSNDGTKEAIKGLRLPFAIRYFFQKNKGPATARNLGIKKAKGQIIVLVDDDIIPTKNFLDEHVKFHKRGDEKLVVLGYSKWDPRIKMTPFRKYITKYHLAFKNITDRNNVDWCYLYSGNVSARKGFFIKGDLFDESFPHAAYEDTELGYKLHKLGMKMIFNKNAIGYHYHPIDFKSYQKTMFCRGRSAVVLAKKVPQLERKASCNETKNPLRYLLKRIAFNDFILKPTVEIINFLDKLYIPFPKIIYTKILGYYRIKGIKDMRS